MTGISAFAATFRRAFHLFAIGVLALSAATLGVIIAPRVVGYETLVVLGSSMDKTYPVGSLVAQNPTALRKLYNRKTFVESFKMKDPKFKAALK